MVQTIAKMKKFVDSEKKNKVVLKIKTCMCLGFHLILITEEFGSINITISVVQINCL